MSDRAKLIENAQLLYDVAATLGKDGAGDPLDMAAALGFAMTKMLFFTFPDPDDAMRAAGGMAESSLKSVADMIAGRDAPHQVSQ